MKFPNVDSLPRFLLVGFLAELLFIECLIYLSSLGQLRAEGQQLETRHGSALQRPLSGKASSDAKRTRERKTTASRAGFRNWKSSFFMKQKTSLSKKMEAKLLGKTRPIFSGGQNAGRRSRADSGGGLSALFPLPVAAQRNKAQSKQTKHNCAFFWFKDDGAAMKTK